MKISGLILTAAFIAASSGFLESAQAAQTAEVNVGLAPLRDGPGGNFDVVKKLPKGSQVQISNYPRQGFYKARIFDGTVGWIDASKVKVLGAIVKARPVVTPVPTPSPVLEPKSASVSSNKKGKGKSSNVKMDEKTTVKSDRVSPPPALIENPPTLDLDVLDTEVK